MRQSTQQRYQRVQAFHQRLSKAKLSHDFCLEIICDFFTMGNSAHIGIILSKDLGDLDPYENQDLDNAWIDARIRKHLDEIAPVESINQEQLEKIEE